MAVHFGTLGWPAVSAMESRSAGARSRAETIGTLMRSESLTKPLFGRSRLARFPGWPGNETQVSLKFIGEIINEDQTILSEVSSGLSIPGHSPKKDGVPACLYAAKANTAPRASLTDKLNPPFKKLDNVETGRIGVRLTPELVRSLNELLAKDVGDIGDRKAVRINRLNSVKFIFADRSRLPSGYCTFGPHRCKPESATDLGGAF